MEVTSVLARFDGQMRRDPPREPGGLQVMRGERITRVVSDAAGWAGVLWSDLDADSADAAIAAEVAWFAARDRAWEWKYYSHDAPADLPRRLRAAGLLPEERETVMVAELARLEVELPPPAGVTVRAVTSRADVDAFVAVQECVFERDQSAFGRYLADTLDREPPAMVAALAWAGEKPICAGRVDLPPGCDFAGIWGGGTVPGWRHRGVFRALVAFRAAIAAARGYRYLQVDASEASRPILTRLGFVEIATTIPFAPPA